MLSGVISRSKELKNPPLIASVPVQVRPRGPHNIEPIESDELDEEYVSLFVPSY